MPAAEAAPQPNGPPMAAVLPGGSIAYFPAGAINVVQPLTPAYGGQTAYTASATPQYFAKLQAPVNFVTSSPYAAYTAYSLPAAAPLTANAAYTATPFPANAAFTATPFAANAAYTSAAYLQPQLTYAGVPVQTASALKAW